MPSPPLPPPHGSALSDVLPWAGALLTGFAGWSAARFTAFAQLNKTILDASRLLVEESQTIHARDGVRILELETEVLRQRGEINQGIQRERSLQHAIERLQRELDEN